MCCAFALLSIKFVHRLERQATNQGDIMKFNTTGLQRANFVVSIGCPRRLEICNEDNQTLPAGVLNYRRS